MPSTLQSASMNTLPPGAVHLARQRSVRFIVRRLFRAESPRYYLLLGATLFMVGFGLTMVLSSSFVDSHMAGNSFLAVFWKQGWSALIGVPTMLIVSRIPSTFWKKHARLILIVAVVLQLLVIATPLGIQAGGNRNWFRLGSFSFQPSEVMKVAIAAWVSVMLVRRRDELSQWKRSLLPVVLVAGAAISLVTAGGDLGTTIILGGMVMVSLFIAGVPHKQLAATVGVASVLVVILAVARPSRLIRILAFLHPGSANPTGVGWQIQNSYSALASGGLFGVGLGNSQSKWGWLPAADTDFIFAIIGNELGLVGCLLVVSLFATITVSFVNIIRASTDQFAQVMTAGILAWIVGEAAVNIGVVLGLLPVLGVPLPLFSAGGTALICTLLAVGIVLSFERETTRSSVPVGRTGEARNKSFARFMSRAASRVPGSQR